MNFLILMFNFIFFFTLNAQEIIYVTADRIKSSIEDSPSDIEVFDQDQIANSFSLTDLLKKSTDVSISQSGPMGGNSSLFLRGSDSSHVLVIFDGIILNDPGNPNRQFDFGKLTLNNIEKIEILKGSQGLLYGSNAIGGVILITSKKAEKYSQVTSNINLGSHQTLQTSFDFQKKFSDTGISLGIEHLKSDGFSAANDNQVKADRDGIERTHFNLNFDQRLSSHNSLNLFYKQMNDRNDLDKNGGAGGDDPNDYQTTKQNFLKAEINHLWINAETKLSYSQSNIKRSLIVKPDAVYPQSSEIHTRGLLKTLGINHAHELSDELSLNSNVDFQNEADNFKNQNHNLSFFNYARFEKQKHVFNLGGRLDKNKYFKDYFTFKTAYMFSFDRTSIKASLSSGFRSPSLNQLFDPVYGNKSLSPEKSLSSEVGVNHKFSETLNGEIAVFRTDIKNRLSYDPGTFINKNFGKARIIGIENNLNIFFSSAFSSHLSATLLRARDLQTKLNLPRRPGFNSRLAIDYSTDRSTLSIEATHTGTRSDVDNFGNSVQMASYTLFNISHVLKWSDHFSNYIKLNNLFNKNYEEVFGYGTGGRLITFGLQYTY